MNFVFHLTGVAHAYVNARRSQLHGELAALDKVDEAIERAAENPVEIANFIKAMMAGGPSPFATEVVAGNETATAAEPAAASDVVDPPPPDPNWAPRAEDLAQPVVQTVADAVGAQEGDTVMLATLTKEHLDKVHETVSQAGDGVRHTLDSIQAALPEMAAHLVEGAVAVLLGTGALQQVTDSAFRLVNPFGK